MKPRLKNRREGNRNKLKMQNPTFHFDLSKIVRENAESYFRMYILGEDQFQKGVYNENWEKANIQEAINLVAKAIWENLNAYEISISEEDARSLAGGQFLILTNRHEELKSWIEGQLK